MTREEIWRFIPNSTIYQVSNLGNFRKIIGDKYRYLKGSKVYYKSELSLPEPPKEQR